MEDSRKKTVITFRVNEKEREELLKLSDKEDKSLSDYIRERVFKEKDYEDR